LVTGANGQLGRELRLKGADTVHRFIFTDIAQVEGLQTRILDMTDVEAVDKLVSDEGVDIIINCAAYTNVDAAEDDPQMAQKLNSTAPAGLALIARAHDALLVQVSTDYVFGGDAYLRPITEEDRPAPLGVYGRTKYQGEQEVIASGCRYLIVRTAWLYSEFCRNFMKTMLSLFEMRSEIRVVEDQRGTPTYAGDLSDAILKMIESPVQGIYHFTNEGECSWYDFASEIASMSITECKVKPCSTADYPSKASRPAYSVLDKTKIKKVYGIQIPQWQESLKTCLCNYRNRLEK